MTAAAGTFSLVKDNLKQLISYSSRFQTWTGESTASAAAAHIYKNVLPSEPVALRPFCIIDYAEGEGYTATRGARAPDLYNLELNLLAVFEDNIASGDLSNASEADVKFENNFGLVLDNLIDLSDTDQGGGVILLQVRQFDSVEIVRGSEDEVSAHGNFYQGRVRVKVTVG